MMTDPAVASMHEMNPEVVTTIVGRNRADPWPMLVKKGYVDAWKAAGLRFFATAEDFDPADYSIATPAPTASYTNRWVNRLMSDYPLELRELAGHTGVQSRIETPSGYFADLPVVAVTENTPGDVKGVLGAPNSNTPSAILSATGSFCIDFGVCIPADAVNVQLCGNGNSTSKLSVFLVGNQLRLIFQSSGLGFRSHNIDLPYNPRGKLMQFRLIRTADNYAKVRYRQRGDEDWTDVTSAEQVKNDLGVTYSIEQDFAAYNFRSNASYRASGFYRYWGVWNAYAAGDAQTSYEQFLVRSNLLV